MGTDVIITGRKTLWQANHGDFAGAVDVKYFTRLPDTNRVGCQHSVIATDQYRWFFGEAKLFG